VVSEPIAEPTPDTEEVAPLTAHIANNRRISAMLAEADSNPQTAIPRANEKIRMLTAQLAALKKASGK